MGSVRCRGTRWHAQVRLNGFRSFTKSFDSKESALSWCKEKENHLLANSHDRQDSKSPSLFSGLCDEYAANRSQKHKGALSEKARIKALSNSPLGSVKVSYITPNQVFDYFELRKHQVQTGSLRKEYFLLKQIFKFGKVIYGLCPLHDPLSLVETPPDSAPRSRRLTIDERRVLTVALTNHRNKVFADCTLLALETGMRRSEIVGICRDDFDQESRVLTIPNTKNGDMRRIPITKQGFEILCRNLRNCSEENLFPISTTCIHQAWKRLMTKLRIDDLRFHDLRHEAISSFFEKGLSIAEVRLISGHRDIRQLFRYTHLRAEDILMKYDL